MFSARFNGRRVLVTGHTGFKGSWLGAWLLSLGADVAGFSDAVPTSPANFDVLGLERRLRDYRGDVRDLGRLGGALDEFRPSVVFHLAAQPLVRQAYARPLETFHVNAIGTANVLEAVRERPWIEALVVITSDKCYRNLEWEWGYRENDALGGDDPYSGSKAAAEMVFHSYARSYFDGAGTRVASARAGNVIGGGDWAADRIVPDCVRSWAAGEVVRLRNPTATRPWQHVLEPLSGYLWLAASMLAQDGARLNGMSFNFGPATEVTQPVSVLVDELARSWPGARWEVERADHRSEARLLKLSCDLALAHLEWQATLSFQETVDYTGEWYGAYYRDGGAPMWGLAAAQIERFERAAAERGRPWTR